jgi:hypothetical protein
LNATSSNPVTTAARPPQTPATSRGSTAVGVQRARPTTRKPECAAPDCKWRMHWSRDVVPPDRSRAHQSRPAATTTVPAVRRDRSSRACLSGDRFLKPRPQSGEARANRTLRQANHVPKIESARIAVDNSRRCSPSANRLSGVSQPGRSRADPHDAGIAAWRRRSPCCEQCERPRSARWHLRENSERFPDGDQDVLKTVVSVGRGLGITYLQPPERRTVLGPDPLHCGGSHHK